MNPLPVPGDFVALVLAAGSSRRMGRDKAALPWLGGRSLLEWTLVALRHAGWPAIVVLGPHNHADWTARLPNAALVLNSLAADGKSTSLARGAAALPARARHILITSVDQPRPSACYRRLRESAETLPNRILVPDHDGRRGHPVVLPAAMRNELQTLRDSALGLRGLLDANAANVHRLPMPPAGLSWDLNTPAAYAEARRWFEAQPPDEWTLA